MWIVGGDEILNRFTVSRKCPNMGCGLSTREWVMTGPRFEKVKVWNNKEKAQAYADKLNKQV